MTALTSARAVRRRARTAVQQKWRRARTTPFAGSERPLLVHATYHKAGTVWFQRILQSVANDFGMRVEIGRADTPTPTGPADIFVHRHSRLDLDALGQFRGTHTVRDPRDIVVSAYRYHLWTDEAWANEPNAKWSGQSYQQYLGSVDEDQGLATEIERLRGDFERMSEWDYDDPRFLELRFEDLRAEGPPAFERVFRHYGFSDSGVECGLHWANYHSWENAKRREAEQGRSGPSHLSSPRSGEGREVLTARHLARIDELAGPLMRRLGYT